MRANRPLQRAAALAALVLLATTGATQVPENTLGFDLFTTAQSGLAPENIGTSLMLVFLITVISLAPALLMMTTCFTRIIVVMGFLRQALATQQTPPNQVLVGMSLFLTFFIMYPTYQQVNENALQPYIDQQISQQEALNEALKPIRAFMFRQTRPENLKLFLDIGNYERPEGPEDISTWVLVPAFTLSELETAFMIGFVLYIPFLIIDMVVASTLMAMGMMMLPPIFVSLPFKIIMFVLADGWRLLIGSLVQSFQT